MYGATNYRWQLYPESQSGHMFWFTTLELGPGFTIVPPLRGKRTLRIKVTSSLLGWTSRPTYSVEKYFYSLTFNDFISNAHQDLMFGAIGNFVHANIKARLTNENRKRLSLAYELDYVGYYQTPRVHIINHSLNLTWKIGKL